MNIPYLAITGFVIPVLPLVVAAALFVPKLQRIALGLAPWVPLTALGLLPLHGEIIDFAWLLLGARVGIDDIALPLVLLASIAWTLAGLHGRHHLPKERRPVFYLLWLLTWTGNLCVFLTLDAASFYAAYAMMTFAAYGLVVFHRRPEDYRAGRIYLIMAVLGEAAIIASLLTMGATLGNFALEAGSPGLEEMTEQAWVIWLLLAGFGVKMGLAGLHMWLPLAHPQAPVPASAVLSGVILKGGLIGWLRFLPIEADGFQIAGMSLAALGLFTALYAVAIGLLQNRAKTVLAYSSVSQMGLISIAVGLALAFPDLAPLLVTSAVLFALHHGLAKSALFLSVDIARHSPRTARLMMWWPALALAGAPLTSGALAKVLLKSGLAEAPDLFEPAMLLSSVATTLLMIHFLRLAWPERETDSKAFARSTLPWQCSILAVIILPWLVAAWLLPEAVLRPFQPGYLAETLLPVLLGVILVLLGRRLLPTHPRPTVPEGDLIALFPRAPTLALPTLRFHSPAHVRSHLRMTLASAERWLFRLAPAILIWSGIVVVMLVLR